MANNSYLLYRKSSKFIKFNIGRYRRWIKSHIERQFHLFYSISVIYPAESALVEEGICHVSRPQK